MDDQEIVYKLQYLTSKIKDGTIPDYIKEQTIDFLQELSNPSPLDRDMVENLFLGWYIKQNLKENSKE